MSQSSSLRLKITRLDNLIDILKGGNIPGKPLIRHTFESDGVVESSTMAESLWPLFQGVLTFGSVDSAIQIHSILSPNWRVSSVNGPRPNGFFHVALNFNDTSAKTPYAYAVHDGMFLAKSWAIAVMKAHQLELKNKLNQSKEQVG